MLVNLPPSEYSCFQYQNNQSGLYLQSSSLQTSFLFVAKTFRDSLSAEVEPEKSRADVSFCGVSLRFPGPDREKKYSELEETLTQTLAN